MARRVTRRTKSRVRTTVKGKIPTPDLHKAIYRGQEKNRDMLLRRVMARFSAKHHGSGHTVQGFQARILADLNLSISNRRPNAARVEYGVDPWLGVGANQGSPPERLILPENPEGYGMLKFFWARMGTWMYLPYVTHPGQRADPVMLRTLQENEDEIEDNIRREVMRELNRV